MRINKDRLRDLFSWNGDITMNGMKTYLKYWLILLAVLWAIAMIAVIIVCT